MAEAGNVGALRLRKVTIKDEQALHAAADAMAEDGFTFAFGLDEQVVFADYVQRLNDRHSGRGLTGKEVPETYLLADVDGAIVGRLSLRHALNEHLERSGGHIGFGVLPAYRRRGYASEILRQGLDLAKSLGLVKVLLTCDERNLGSRAVIEGQGGVRDTSALAPAATSTRHYWIALP